MEVRAFVIDPKVPQLLAALPSAVEVESFDALMAQVPPLRAAA